MCNSKDEGQMYKGAVEAKALVSGDVTGVRSETCTKTKMSPQKGLGIIS